MIVVVKGLINSFTGSFVSTSLTKLLTRKERLEMLLHTKDELEQLHKDRLQELVDYAGSWYHLGHMLGINPGAVQSWVRKGKISKKGAQIVEAHPRLGEMFKAEELRLDHLTQD